MSSSETPLIELKNVSKTYRNDVVETQVLYDINLQIRRGEFVSIMGPSGSGKSTLMHIIGFLDTPSQGQYLFQGKAAATLNDDDLAIIRATRVSFVFQAFNLLPRTTVFENVQLPLLYHPTIKAADRQKLTPRAQYLTNQLSGGQQQRVAIARALVTQPDVIFADEPTGNLDSASGVAVMEALQKLHKEGHTIILVTHERTTAEHAERIIHIKDGRIQSDSRDFKRIIATDTLELK